MSGSLSMVNEDSSQIAAEEIDDNRQISLIRDALTNRNRQKLQRNLQLLYDKYSSASTQSQIYIKFVFSNLLTILYPHLPVKEAAQTPPLEILVSELYLQSDLNKIVEQVRTIGDRIAACFLDESEPAQKELLIVLNYISMHYEQDLSVNMLASLVYFTPDYLSRLFKKSMGKTLSQYIRQFRMEKAREALLQTNKRVIEIGADVGYPNYSYFCQSFREYFGLSPEKYRQENRNDL